MESRKHPSAAFVATVTLVVALVGYPLSFGPVCRLAYSLPLSDKELCYFYWPLVRAAKACPSELPEKALWRYGNFCQPPGYEANTGLAAHEWVLSELF
jgi:hypothetical protein